LPAAFPGGSSILEDRVSAVPPAFEPVEPSEGSPSPIRRLLALPRLPRPSTPFVGREREAAEIAALLGRDDLRLLTLTGSAGIGKTRLALRVAEEVGERFPDGIGFVGLAALREAGLVLPAIADALEIRSGDEAATVDRLMRTIGQRRVLLILDNAEQVVGSGPQLAALLSACPALRLLVTSRAGLRLSGEHEYPVPPLGLPHPARRATAAEIAAAEAVQLLVRRAAAVRNDFALTEENAPAVAAICARLDGLPLAIELAAARVKLLPPPALLSRLSHRLDLLTAGPRDAPVRQQTMRAAIAWSYDLLHSDEQALFRRLAVFAGGCTLEAAEYVGRGSEVEGRGIDAVALDPLPSTLDSVLDGLASLVDKSLVRQEEGADGEPRFSMLETVREFGLERLVEEGEEPAIWGRLLAWCLTLVEAAAQYLEGAKQELWLDRLAVELENLRAALAWAIAHGTGREALRLAGGLWAYWFARGGLAEGRDWLERAKAQSGAGADADAWLTAIGGGAMLAMAQVQLDRATAEFAETIALANASGDRGWLGRAEFGLGVIAQDRGDPVAARLHFEAALAAFQAAGDETWCAVALNNLGLVVARSGDLKEGRRLLEEALARHLALGYAVGAALSRRYLGQVARAEGDEARAARHFRDSLRIEVARAQVWHVAGSLEGLAGTLARSQPVLAARLLGAAAAHREEGGVPIEPAMRQQHERDVDGLRERLGAPKFAEAVAAGRALGPVEAVAALEAVETRMANASAQDPAGAVGLSERELAVLRLLAEGRSSREIGEALFISPRTATTHVTNILGKLGVDNRASAVSLAYRLGILRPSKQA
jgi:non-specific serine/threonine protein kinase